MKKHQSPDQPNGVLIIDKPKGLVSMRVVERVRRLTRIKRAGHAGTLDPAATGVLPVCLGGSTKIASLILGEDKEYEATVRLGLVTDSCDLDGEVLDRAEVPSTLTEERLEEVLAPLTGAITQRPPAHSAIRVDGERLYNRVRRGEAVEAPERQVLVHELKLLDLKLPDFRIRVRCGKGTYIRSLAADIGRALGCGGCLAELRRTRVGALGLDRSLSLDDLAEAVASARLDDVLVSPADALAFLATATVKEEAQVRLGHGQPLVLDDIHEEELPKSSHDDNHVRLLDDEGRLIALAFVEDELIKPRRVFLKQEP